MIARVEFPLALLISAVLHVAVLVIWAAMPAGDYGGALPVYKVQIVQAPPKPRARQLSAREATAALDIEVPAPREAIGEAPAFPELEVPESEGPGEARTPASQLAQPSAAPAAPETPTAPSPPRAEQPPTQPVSPEPQAEPDAVAAVSPPAAPESGPVRALPRPLSPAPRQPPGPPDEPPPPRTPPAPPAAPGAATAPPSTDALEAARRRIAEAQRQLPPAAPSSPAAVRQPELESNPLATLANRRYRSGLQGRVKEQHTYPADFPCGIEALVQIELARDGTLLASELLESSGDERYDLAVRQTIRATEYAPVPPEISGETYTAKLRFTPKRCPSRPD